MPMRRAIQKWPYSCTATRMPMATRNASEVSQYRHAPARAACPSLACARSRAQRSASRMSPMSRAGALRCALITPSISAGMPRKSSRPSRNAATATSLAALSAAGAVPPASAAAARQPQRRKPRQVRSLEIEPRGGHEIQRFYTGRRSAPANRARGRWACACPGCRAAPGSTRPRTPPSNARCSADVRPR